MSNTPALTEIYTLSLHDALPIWTASRAPTPGCSSRCTPGAPGRVQPQACRPRPARAGSHPDPSGWQHVPVVDARIVHPPAGCQHQLVRPRVEPGAPPTEAAVGDDVMPAGAHESQLWVFRVRSALTDERDRVVEPEVGGDPAGIIRKQEQVRTGKAFGEARHTASIVVRRANAARPARSRIRDVIASPDVHTD